MRCKQPKIHGTYQSTFQNCFSRCSDMQYPNFNTRIPIAKTFKVRFVPRRVSQRPIHQHVLSSFQRCLGEYFRDHPRLFARQFPRLFGCHLDVSFKFRQQTPDAIRIDRDKVLQGKAPLIVELPNRKALASTYMFV